MTQQERQSRAVICLYCAKSVGYDGEQPLPEIVTAMEAHDRICEFSPLGAMTQRCAELTEENALLRRSLEMLARQIGTREGE